MKKKVPWIPLKQYWSGYYNLLINLIKTHTGKKGETIKLLIEPDFMFLGQKTNQLLSTCKWGNISKIYKVGYKGHIRHTCQANRRERLEVKMKISLMKFHSQKVKTLP